MNGPKPQNEAEFQAHVIHVARQMGWGITASAWLRQTEEATAYGIEALPLDGLVFHPRFSVGSEAGWPDLVLVRRRDKRVLFRELKADKGRVSPRQAAVLELLRAVGLDAGVWRPSDEDRIQGELA